MSSSTLPAEETTEYSLNQSDKQEDCPSDPPSAPLTFRAPNCAKSIIDRKLRKFASETSFATETASESSLDRDIDQQQQRTVPSSGYTSTTAISTGKGRVFTVRTIGRSNGRTGINQQMSDDGAIVCKSNRIAGRRRHDSDASGSNGSEATVASGTTTPRRAMRRPKSSAEIIHTSATSATIHSYESGNPLDERRHSHVYVLDDDSLHEFDDGNGELE